MKLNYVENQNGRRVIRWTNLCAFFVAALLTPAASGCVFRLLLGGDPKSAAFHGAGLGFIIFVAALVCSLLMPIERLPRSA